MNNWVTKLQKYRARIKDHEGDIHAWASLDWDFVERQVADLDSWPKSKRGPLYGVPFGVKDIFDTVDLPTTYGSEIYKGTQPVSDAASVARLRAAGAIIMGKTVSTEFAYLKPTKTKNPIDFSRTPGGSSSGSAAAVADKMIPFALGSQTAASIIQPASYCGVIGFKPTWGLISTAGVKTLASSLDTVGVIAETVGCVSDVVTILTGAPDFLNNLEIFNPPNLAILFSPEWTSASTKSLIHFSKAVSLARASGANINEGKVPVLFENLASEQAQLMAYEATRDLAYERHVYFDQLSQPLRDLFFQGEGISVKEYLSINQNRARALCSIEELFGDSDALLAPSTVDIAPKTEEGTGDPVMSRTWTLLGLPSITLPCGYSKNGLPFGLQIACRPRDDSKLLAIAQWFERIL